jgi:hypothetical protein
MFLLVHKYNFQDQHTRSRSQQCTSCRNRSPAIRIDYSRRLYNEEDIRVGMIRGGGIDDIYSFYAQVYMQRSTGHGPLGSLRVIIFKFKSRNHYLYNHRLGQAQS